MATKHSVIDPRGVTHTRTSQNRVYPFVVLVRDSYEHALARAVGPDYAASDRKNYAYYVALANGTHAHCKNLYSNDDAAKRIADAKAYIAGCDTFDAYLAKQQVERVARVDARKAKGDFDTWGPAGWCGRRDLAEKLAHKERAGGYRAEVIIAETIIK